MKQCVLLVPEETVEFPSKKRKAFFACQRPSLIEEEISTYTTTSFVLRCLLGPQTCECIECVPLVSLAAPPPPSSPASLIMTHNWADFRTCDPFPPAKDIRAFGRSLTTFPGENLDQYVALWYQSGEPVLVQCLDCGGGFVEEVDAQRSELVNPMLAQNTDRDVIQNDIAASIMRIERLGEQIRDIVTAEHSLRVYSDANQSTSTSSSGSSSDSSSVPAARGPAIHLSSSSSSSSSSSHSEVNVRPRRLGTSSQATSLFTAARIRSRRLAISSPIAPTGLRAVGRNRLSSLNAYRNRIINRAPTTAAAFNRFHIPINQDHFNRLISLSLDSGNNDTKRIASKDLMRLPMAKVSKQQVDDLAQCVTCMDVFVVQEKVAKLDCEHIFHRQCIIPWLKRSDSCPLCRRVVEPKRWQANAGGDTQS
uniref:RING-type domain-containing protein n=1 Tax=Ditylenchus dipsaci TaxID=166011 RepID=A0A915E5P1_9BILA